MKYEITYLNQSNDFSFHFSKRLRKTCFKTSQVRHDLNHLGFKIINFRVKIFNLYHFGILINNFGQLCIQIILKAKNIEINSLHLCNLISKQMYQLSFDKLIIFRFVKRCSWSLGSWRLGGWGLGWRLAWRSLSGLTIDESANIEAVHGNCPKGNCKTRQK